MDADQCAYGSQQMSKSCEPGEMNRLAFEQCAVACGVALSHILT